MVNLGDVLDFHQYGFNDPPPDKSIARAAYLNYRALLGDTTANAAHYEVLGGWDSEAGCDTPDEVDRSRSQRLLYVPGPDPTTYPEGGGAFENYYAFTWGDALFVMLDVFAYTPGCHLLGAYPGLVDDWTLGAEQLAWLRGVLAKATAKWKFIFIHHPVGGMTPDPIESAYGRGGGLAASVGEQAVVHQLMRDHGVQVFFYGHDHVFTDMTVDGIHYALPGSAGAPWMFTQEQTGYATSWPDSGWGRVDVTPDSVRVRFINLAGETLYQFTLPPSGP
jgi:3',5'-cyclic AMP phosphodiesterase CpdA